MTGWRLVVPTELLAESDVAYSWDHFIGFRVLTPEREPVGTILEVNDQTENILLTIETSDGTQRLIPCLLYTSGSTTIQVGEHTIEFKPPYRRLTMIDAIQEYGGVNIDGMDEAELRKVCQAKGVEIDETMGVGKLIDELFGAVAEPHLVQPTFIIDYPKAMSPLTKEHRDRSDLTERFELFVNGKELANAYSELNDPIDQRHRFEDQLHLSERGDDEAMYIDHDFLRALEFGMPPTSGCLLYTSRCV